MTFPVGGIADAGVISGFAQTDRPSKSKLFTGGGSDMDLTDQATNKMYPCATEFVCTVSGTLVARLIGDSFEQTYTLVAPSTLYGLFVLAKGTSSATGIFRQ